MIKLKGINLRHKKGCDRLRGYRADLGRRVLPDLGARKVGTIEHRDIQRLIDSLVAKRRLSDSRYGTS